MKSASILLFATTFVSSIFISPSIANNQCNDFVDGVLNQLKQDKEFFQEPYEIPAEQKSFAIYEIKSGRVYGLNTLHRIHDVLPMKKGSPHLKVYLGAGELNLQCDVKKKFFNFGKSANVEGKIPFISMELDVVPKTDGSYPEIKSFKVDDVKGLSVKVSGVGLIRDILLNAILSTMRRIFTTAIRTGIEDRMKSFLKDKVKDFSIPIECLNEAWD